MGPWELWAALIVGAAVWIVGHLLKNSVAAEEEKRKLSRPPGAEDRPLGQPRRPAAGSSDLNRFLQEVNRRKQTEEQRTRAAEARPVAAAAPRSSVDAPLEARVERAPSPPPVRRPPRETIPLVRPRQPGRRAERDVTIVPEALAVEPALPVALAVGALPTVLPALPAKAGAVRPPPVKSLPPGMGQLATLLRSKGGLQAGILFGEILAPPLCHRRR
jgi:hypothetical protein